MGVRKGESPCGDIEGELTPSGFKQARVVSLGPAGGLRVSGCRQPERKALQSHMLPAASVLPHLLILLGTGRLSSLPAPAPTSVLLGSDVKPPPIQAPLECQGEGRKREPRGAGWAEGVS